MLCILTLRGKRAQDQYGQPRVKIGGDANGTKTGGMLASITAEGHLQVFAADPRRTSRIEVALRHFAENSRILERCSNVATALPLRVSDARLASQARAV